MYDINMTIDNTYGTYDYIYKSKNDHGQIISFTIWRMWVHMIKSPEESKVFTVTFYITTKRKNGFMSNCITGKDGIKSLLWAKRCLLLWINKYKDQYKGYEIRIYASDNRRMNAYIWALKDFILSKTNNHYLYYKL